MQRVNHVFIHLSRLETRLEIQKQSATAAGSQDDVLLPNAKREQRLERRILDLEEVEADLVEARVVEERMEKAEPRERVDKEVVRERAEEEMARERVEKEMARERVEEEVEVKEEKSLLEQFQVMTNIPVILSHLPYLYTFFVFKQHTYYSKLCSQLPVG
jgi:hypothetical protein